MMTAFPTERVALPIEYEHLLTVNIALGLKANCLTFKPIKLLDSFIIFYYYSSSKFSNLQYRFSKYKTR